MFNIIQWWLSSLVVRAMNLQVSGYEFAPKQPHYRSVGTGTGDHLQAGIPSWPGQLSLLTSVGQEMSTGQSAMMRCSWVVKAG